MITDINNIMYTVRINYRSYHFSSYCDAVKFANLWGGKLETK